MVQISHVQLIRGVRLVIFAVFMFVIKQRKWNIYLSVLRYNDGSLDITITEIIDNHRTQSIPRQECFSLVTLSTPELPFCT